ncbi:hypothetical protein TNCV_2839041 [Trichonephila clavipes]|nr:hypothetical protein TNCV_2839041 [Trichonephila clavipes]
MTCYIKQKLTPFMSTLDLRAGYHQVKVHVEDQDKSCSICIPFGTYRFLRMPYGLVQRTCYVSKTDEPFLMVWKTF